MRGLEVVTRLPEPKGNALFPLAKRCGFLVRWERLRGVNFWERNR
jgi:hypothetical protein